MKANFESGEGQLLLRPYLWKLMMIFKIVSMLNDPCRMPHTQSMNFGFHVGRW